MFDNMILTVVQLPDQTIRHLPTLTAMQTHIQELLEMHHDHLPLETDFLNGHRSVCLAAEKEAAVKVDQAVPTLEQEFFACVKKVTA